MYFPINDILNNTVFGVQRDFYEEIDTIIDQIIANNENEA